MFLEFHIRIEPSLDRTELYAFEKRDGKRAVVKRWVVIEEPHDLNKPIEPCAIFHHRNELQSLFNELWRVGYRPEGETFTEKTASALSEHISDLRYVMKRLLPEKR